MEVLALRSQTEAAVARTADKNSAQSALEELGRLCRENGRAAEPFLCQVFPNIVSATEDKVESGEGCRG